MYLPISITNKRASLAATATALLTLLAAGALATAACWAREPAAGKKAPRAEKGPQLSASGLVEIWPGELPVVLSAPHGGTEKPASIPDRAYGTMNLDGGTRELAYQVREAFAHRFGQAPPLVVCLLSRRKVDCNRAIEEGAQGHPVARQVWLEFQEAIVAAEESLLARHRQGIYFDIHAHGHAAPVIELGYGLTARQLSAPADELNRAAVAQSSTVRLLAEKSAAPFSDVVRGSGSFGALLEGKGVPAIPSPQRPVTAATPYFNGGYNVRLHGSADGKGLDAIQLETPGAVRRTRETRAAFAKALAEVTATYLNEHYGVKLGEVSSGK